MYLTEKKVEVLYRILLMSEEWEWIAKYFDVGTLLTMHAVAICFAQIARSARHVGFALHSRTQGLLNEYHCSQSKMPLVEIYDHRGDLL